MRIKSGRETMKVTIEDTIEVGGVERDVKLKYMCHPGEDASRTSPGCPPEAEFLSGFFCDTGDDAEDFIDPSEYEEEALEQADEIAGAEADAAAEAKYERRRDEGF